MDLLLQLPGNAGDPQGMRVKAAQLERLCGRVEQLDRDVAAAVDGANQYRGPAADELRRTMRARHEEMQQVVGRIHRVRERLARAASVMQSVDDDVEAIRRRIKRDVDILGSDAGRLVKDAQEMARHLGRL